MDSLKTKITSAPQMSGVQTLAFDRVDEDGNTVNDFAVTTGTATSILIPKNAYVVAGHIICDTALAGEGSTSTIEIGIPAGVSQVDGSSTVSADPDAIGAQLDLDGLAASHNVTNCWVLPGTSTSTTYSSSSEKVVPVEIKVVVNSSDATAGKIYWYVEYVFLPNISWDQNLL
tara:strand:+ start:2267 stop:2785 length:519 start_codon:yes stop_codon:yes gene_type:complete